MMEEAVTIYVDIVLLENLCMNYIILFGTAYIIKIKVMHLRILLASLIGAIYAVLAYAGIFPIYANLITKIILSICMTYIAFNPKKLKGLIKELIVFYLVSFALGGCAFALLYIVRPQDIFMKNGVYIGTYPLKIALLGGITGFVITYVAIKIVKTRITKNEIIYKAIIEIENQELEINVLLDTGNMLKDPISDDAVIMIEKNRLYKIVPKELLDNMNKFLGGEFENAESLEYKKRIRFIPFTSVGKQNGMLLGIKADLVKIITDVDEIINEKAIIGVYEKTFSKSGKYSGLIGLDILERSEADEHLANIKK